MFAATSLIPELEEVLRVSHTVGVLRDRTLVATLENGPELTEDVIMSTIASGANAASGASQ